MPKPDTVIHNGVVTLRVPEGLYWLCDELVWCAGGPSVTPTGDLIVMYTVLTSDVPGRMNSLECYPVAAAWHEVATLVLRADFHIPPFPKRCGECKWWTRQMLQRGACEHPQTLRDVHPGHLTVYETADPPPTCPRRSDLPTK